MSDVNWSQLWQLIIREGGWRSPESWRGLLGGFCLRAALRLLGPELVLDSVVRMALRRGLATPLTVLPDTDEPTVWH